MAGPGVELRLSCLRADLVNNFEDSFQWELSASLTAVEKSKAMWISDTSHRFLALPLFSRSFLDILSISGIVKIPVMCLAVDFLPLIGLAAWGPFVSEDS